ncbi:MAG: YihY/virulence factor BrkB family protein [Caldimicrobium sp.]
MFLKPLKIFYQKISRDEILLYAQGLTYNTLLTLIPLLGIIISFGRNFLNEDSLIYQSFSFFSNYLTTEALIVVMEKIIGLLENLKKFPLGKFSILFYFLMSLGLLFQIEDCLNRIFLSFKRRSLKDRLLFYWIALTFAPFIFFLPLFLQTSFKNFLGYTTVFYFLFLLGFFYLIYIYFPARKVSKIASLGGSLFATVLWFSFSFLFGIYVRTAVSYSKLYGSLSVIPIFLLFVFLNWLIFLIGAEISYFIEKKPWKKKTMELHTPYKEILILLELSKNFYMGKILTLEDLNKLLPLSEEELLLSIRNLEKKGIITLKDEELFFKKPPENIKLSEILNLEEIERLEREEKMGEYITKLCPLKENILGKTLKDLLDL